MFTKIAIWTAPLPFDYDLVYFLFQIESFEALTSNVLSFSDNCLGWEQQRCPTLSQVLVIFMMAQFIFFLLTNNNLPKTSGFTGLILPSQRNLIQANQSIQYIHKYTKIIHITSSTKPLVLYLFNVLLSCMYYKIKYT